MKIARVFPRQTKMTPDDDDAFVGDPPLGCPQYDEIHISVCFTWDIDKSHYLAGQWRPYGKIRIGGPALDKSQGDFIPGRYLKKGVTITSRGCPNKCWFCLVHQRTNGILTELPIMPGRIVQDDNLLACSSKHIESVFNMLKGQSQIEFKGGFESLRVTPSIVEKLTHLRIKRIWLAYDTPDDEEPLRVAIENLKPYFSREQIRCYVLIGYPGDTLCDAEKRLKRAWHMGTLPFSMRYRKPAKSLNKSFVCHEREWNILTRQWTRPNITKAIMKNERSEND
jgi:hypothetical protein